MSHRCRAHARGMRLVGALRARAGADGTPKGAALVSHLPGETGPRRTGLPAAYAEQTATDRP